MCNVDWIDVFAPRWIALFTLMQHHYNIFTDYHSFIFNILCIKLVVTYSKVNFVNRIVLKLVIKFLYKGGRFSNKVMTTSFFLRIPLSKQDDLQMPWICWCSPSACILYLACKNLVENEVSLWQALHFMNVGKGFQYLCWSLQLLMYTSWLSTK